MIIFNRCDRTYYC